MVAAFRSPRRHARDRPGPGVVEIGLDGRVDFVGIYDREVKLHAGLEQDCQIGDVVVELAFEPVRGGWIETEVFRREPVRAWRPLFR